MRHGAGFHCRAAIALLAGRPGEYSQAAQRHQVRLSVAADTGSVEIPRIAKKSERCICVYTITIYMAPTYNLFP